MSRLSDSHSADPAGSPVPEPPPPRDLSSLGFSPRWQAVFAALTETEAASARPTVPGRVIRADRGSALVASPSGIVRAKPSAALLKSIGGPHELPTVGDWVALHAPPDLDVPLIDAVLPRSSAITRGDPRSEAIAQVLAANVDIVFIVHPIDSPPGLRRIERELSVAWDSGALPIVVLSKADACDDADAAHSAVQDVAFGVEVLVTSALTGVGVESLRKHLADQHTGALIGPSGSGKSSLINALLGEHRQLTREVRVSDRRGRHTTVARELVALPDGGLLIDTPGLRSLALTGSDAGISTAFPDIEDAAQSCRFRDCTHTSEPGCAVLEAVEAGELPAARLQSYHKLQREAVVAAMKTDPRLRSEEMRKWKIIRKSAREHQRLTGKE